MWTWITTLQSLWYIYITYIHIVMCVCVYVYVWDWISTNHIPVVALKNKSLNQLLYISSLFHERWLNKITLMWLFNSSEIGIHFNLLWFLLLDCLCRDLLISEHLVKTSHLPPHWVFALKCFFWMWDLLQNLLRFFPTDLQKWISGRF